MSEDMKTNDINKIVKEDDSILAVYLFGSQAKHKSNKYSDIDIAVLYNDKVRPEEYTDRQIALMNNISRALNKETDIIVLNRAPLFLRYTVLKEGLRIYERAGRNEHNFEAVSIIQYLDFLPIKNRIEDGLLRKIREA